MFSLGQEQVSLYVRKSFLFRTFDDGLDKGAVDFITCYCHERRIETLFETTKVVGTNKENAVAQMML